MSQYLGQIPSDAYDIIIFFDCRPAIRWQAMSAVFAADVHYTPSGPGYWEYDNMKRFIGRLAEALKDMGRFRGVIPADRNRHTTFAEIKFLLIRREPNNDAWIHVIDHLKRIPDWKN